MGGADRGGAGDETHGRVAVRQDARPAIPVMRSFSEALAREFYVDFLGFEVMFEHRHSADAPLYLSLQLDGCTLHLTEHFGDAAPGAAVRIPVADVDALCEALRAKNYPQAHPTVSVKPWGAREMSIADPFGNRLTFATEES